MYALDSLHTDLVKVSHCHSKHVQEITEVPAADLLSMYSENGETAICSLYLAYRNESGIDHLI